MFTCTECAQCISACQQVQHKHPQGGLLQWVAGEDALPVVTGRPLQKQIQLSQPAIKGLEWKNK